MPGKERGLGSKVREFIARLQKEIDFPAVYSLRIHILVRARDGLPKMRPRFHTFPALLTQLKTFSLQWPVRVHTAQVSEPTLRVLSIFSKQAVFLRDLNENWLKPAVHNQAPGFFARVHHPEMQLARPKVWGRIPPISGLKLHRSRAMRPWSIRIHNDSKPIQKIPIKIPIISVPDLPKALIIRYRATILKMLGWSPAELEWAGVSQRLPPVALQPVGLEEEDSQIKVLLAWTARHHSHGEDRVMALVRKAGTDSWVFLPLREG